MSDFLGVLNAGPERKPDPNVALALLLRYLAGVLEAVQGGEKSVEGQDGRATEPEEIRVRPRIEPLGGG